MIGPTKFIEAGGPDDRPYPIIEPRLGQEPPDEDGSIWIKALIDDRRFERLGIPLPPLDDALRLPGQPSRYIEYPIPRAAYDDLPVGKYDMDDHERITRIVLNPGS